MFESADLMHIGWRVLTAHPSDATWLLWIEQDGQGNRVDRLWAGRVKLQDDPIATSHAVLYDALQKLETSLGGPDTLPMF